jgi:hypothetical protein
MLCFGYCERSLNRIISYEVIDRREGGTYLNSVPKESKKRLNIVI